MRKLLISVLIFLLLIVTVYSIVKGISIGNIKILGFNSIKYESENIDKQIEEINKLKTQGYEKTISDMENAAKQLVETKKQYADLVSMSTEEEIQEATYEEKYEQDFLWAKIGNHATSTGIKVRYDISTGTTNKENFDLNFTVIGKYINIIEFIRVLEDDNLLSFTIEDFKMLPTAEDISTAEYKQVEQDVKNDDNILKATSTNSGKVTLIHTDILTATFNVKDIGINIDKTEVEAKTTTTNTTNTTTTNTTNTNTANANTINTTNEGTQKK